MLRFDYVKLSQQQTLIWGIQDYTLLCRSMSSCIYPQKVTITFSRTCLGTSQGMAVALNIMARPPCMNQPRTILVLDDWHYHIDLPFFQNHLMGESTFWGGGICNVLSATSQFFHECIPLESLGW